MNFKAQYLPYQQTGAFSRIVIDYIENAASLQPFYSFSPDIDGVKKAIGARKENICNRQALIQQLKEQYTGFDIAGKVSDNINSLANADTYTICTAHQPNIFTGHLYFIYKIMHAIKLADELNETLAGKHFVPVFYMGSEDADLDELGEVTINSKKYKWETKQKGAVGRMKVDQQFIELIEGISGQLLVEPYGNEVIEILKRSYTPGTTIERATFALIHTLFSKYGLVVLLPDNRRLKELFIPVMEKELKEQFSHAAVTETIAGFPKEYKVQAAGRKLNLFYLKDDTRERIEPVANGFVVSNTAIAFSSDEILEELHTYPERFSPNVILRPVYQEIILPNIAFIGGGGELAYWLELKKVFERVQAPFPVLVLRNSFVVVKDKEAAMIASLGFMPIDLFESDTLLVNRLVKNGAAKKIDLDAERDALAELYNKISAAATAVDPTLQKHISALSSQAIKRVMLAEKKMQRAEKKKYEAEIRHIGTIKNSLFPGGVLQERINNLLPYYAIWGFEFIDMVYTASCGLDHKFCILEVS